MGVDFSAGREHRGRNALVRSKRFSACARRSRRLRLLAKADQDTAAKVFFAGFIPSATYDAPVLGLFGRHLSKVRRQAAKVLGISGPRRSADLEFLYHQDKDPEVRTATSVVRMLSGEVWKSFLPNAWKPQGSLPPGVVASGLQAYVNANEAPPRFASGPLSAFHKALVAAGWSWPGPLRCITRDGLQVHLHAVCPARIVKIYRNDYAKAIAHRAMVKLHAQVSSNESQRLVDRGLFFEPLVKVAAKLPKFQSALLVKFVSHAILTRGDLFELGYSLDPACPLCGNAVDHVLHRCYHCIQIENDLMYNIDHEFISQNVGDPDCFLKLTRCLFPRPVISSTASTNPIISYCNLGRSLDSTQSKVMSLGMGPACSQNIPSSLERGFPWFRLIQRETSSRDCGPRCPLICPRTPCAANSLPLLRPLRFPDWPGSCLIAKLSSTAGQKEDARPPSMTSLSLVRGKRHTSIIIIVTSETVLLMFLKQKLT